MTKCSGVIGMAAGLLGAASPLSLPRFGVSGMGRVSSSDSTSALGSSGGTSLTACGKAARMRRAEPCSAVRMSCAHTSGEWRSRSREAACGGSWAVRSPAGSTPRAVAPPRNHLPMQARRPLLSPACSCPRAVAAARKTATGRRHLRGCVWGRGWGGWVSHAGADWARARQRTAAGRRGWWRDAGRGAAWRGVARRGARRVAA